MKIIIKILLWIWRAWTARKKARDSLKDFFRKKIESKLEERILMLLITITLLIINIVTLSYPLKLITSILFTSIVLKDIFSLVRKTYRAYRKYKKYKKYAPYLFPIVKFFSFLLNLKLLEIISKESLITLL